MREVFEMDPPPPSLLFHIGGEGWSFTTYKSQYNVILMPMRVSTKVVTLIIYTIVDYMQGDYACLLGLPFSPPFDVIA